MLGPSRSIPATIAVIVFVAGCGGSSSTSSAAASKTAFCADNAKLNQATAANSTLGQLLSTLKSDRATIDDFGRTAPSDIKVKAELLVAGAHAAIKANSAAAFSTAKYVDTGTTVNAYCRQDAKGNPLPAASSSS